MNLQALAQAFGHLKCTLCGHRWGKPRAIGCTGEFESICTSCGASDDDFSEDSGFLHKRMHSLREAYIEVERTIKCLFGRHSTFKYGTDEECFFCDYRKPTQPEDKGSDE